MTDWWPPARRCPSPHQDARPEGVGVELIVIHAISLPPEQFGGPYIDDLFMGQLDPNAHPYFAGLHGIKVSAHIVIRRDGEAVQYVPFSRRAWHAGVSCWQGRTRCNDFSIGIELEGSDHQPFTDRQYARLIELIAWLRAAYPILDSDERLVGHQHIAPGRKTDPGPYFDWSRVGHQQFQI